MFRHTLNSGYTAYQERITVVSRGLPVAPKLKKSSALTHPDFESILIAHIFRNFGVSRTTGSEVIFAFVKDT